MIRADDEFPFLREDVPGGSKEKTPKLGRTRVQTPKVLPKQQSLSPSLPRYSSAFWLWDHDAEARILRITIGWSMPAKSGFLSSGAWTLRSSMRSEEFLAFSILSPVEETHGAVFHKPDPLEEEVNTHVERLVADWLLFLMHRMLFNQCTRLEPRIPTGVVTDILLVFGPTLPKFVGRVCYSSFTRQKTIAILAPNLAVGQPPEQSDYAWSDEPIPRFCHDCAQRRWIANGPAQEPSKQRICSFDLIEPIGDGFSGAIHSGVRNGPAQWLAKSQGVREIVDTDRVEVKFAIWKNRAVRVPLGMKHAIRAALLQQELDRCDKRLDDLRAQLNATSKQKVNVHKKQAHSESMGVSRDPLFQSVVASRATCQYAERLLNRVPDKATEAKRTSTKRDLRLIGNALIEQLGEAVAPD